MDEQTYTVVSLLFWTLTAGVVLLPLRWAIFLLIVLSHVSVIAPHFQSAREVGIQNSVRAIGLPTLLLLRLFWRRGWSPKVNLPAVLWVLLAVYASVSALWSPFPVSAFKMVGFMCCYGAMAVIFTEAWRRKLLSPPLLSVALWLALLLGTVQTYLAGNPFGRSLQGIEHGRFTSFSSPQSFGAFLLATLAIIVFSNPPLWALAINGIGAVAGLVLCGSRYLFVAGIAMCVLAWLSYVYYERKTDRKTMRLVSGATAIVIAGILVAVYFTIEQDNRINRVVSLAIEGEPLFEKVGTFAWRKGIYSRALELLGERDPAVLLVGSGTSSGAQVVLGLYLQYNEFAIDANRIVHNEFLRSLFEWGIIGLSLLVMFLVGLFRHFLRLGFRHLHLPAFAFISLIPMILLGCMFENLSAASASPAGVGLTLTMAYGLLPAIRSKSSSVFPVVLGSSVSDQPRSARSLAGRDGQSAGSITEI